jgi:hypothetical protein
MYTATIIQSRGLKVDRTEFRDTPMDGIIYLIRA